MHKLLNKLINCRKSQGLSQKQVAQKASLSWLSVQKIESGNSSPQLDTIIQISQALGYELELIASKVDYDYLAVCGMAIMEPHYNMQDFLFDEDRLIEETRKAVQQQNQQDERMYVALMGFCLAIKNHFPQLYKKIGLNPKIDLNDAKIIKLSRISLSRLAELI
tara:strand:+ start:2352 stop:2843 length:492 start_codon:yes stop_codon:yes gene_type:complete